GCSSVAVIVAGGGTTPAKAAKATTSTIPIVFIGAADPVKAGAMKAAAKSLRLATSDHTLQRTEGAVHGSNEASANVETVAAAAEELSASIKEISRQLVQANENRAQRHR